MVYRVGRTKLSVQTKQKLHFCRQISSDLYLHSQPIIKANVELIVISLGRQNTVAGTTSSNYSDKEANNL